ncbi:MAG TPA: hypothetical protein VLS89_12445 [Candidatus Nanopelagicales bacterium]|nr:hypothetical protein [Candidatus Nanopelagicales bacterium]
MAVLEKAIVYRVFVLAAVIDLLDDGRVAKVELEGRGELAGAAAVEPLEIADRSRDG